MLATIITERLTWKVPPFRGLPDTSRDSDSDRET